ncbi:MAG: ACP S-malonyltransferase [Proteobacteria bacterium]|nr:ACP S-malonyltransferase [Pseudomonadota bacterium]
MSKRLSHLGFVFPGQGSQQIGMLKAMSQMYPVVGEVFGLASAALNKDLWEIAQFGPETVINDTVNTQPLLLTASYALWQVWQKVNGVQPALMAGHSLGEYSALVCAQSLSLTDAVKLVAMRGKFMQEAVPQGVGAMAAVIGMEDALLAEVCKTAAENEVVAPVNLNAPGQTVIAGHKSAVERASALAKTKGAKKIIMLPVSVPSHCALMKPAADLLAQYLTNVRIESPKIPVIQNVNVEISQHPDDIRANLVKQLYQPVRWVETVQRLASEGISVAFECGPGKVLCGLIKRISPDIKAMGIETPEELTTASEILA